MTAPSFRTVLVLLLVQWRKVVERLGCLLQGDSGSCVNAVSGGNLKLRLKASTSELDILWQDQFVVWAAVSWEEHTGCPAKGSCARCCSALSALSWARCCVPGPDCSVLLALLLWTLVTVGEASVRLASPW